MNKFSKYFLLLFLLPEFAFGNSIRITEIMYDVAGTDSGFEWIEVLNTGTDPIDLTAYKFFENNTAHSITHLTGSVMLAANSYAIIADNSEKFISLFTNLPTSQIYDSAFSLSNTGEYLAIKDKESNIIHEINYDSSLGANGDGNSLHVGDSGQIISGPVTPLGSFSGSTETEEVSDTSPVSSTNNSSNSSTVKINKGFIFDIPKIATVNHIIPMKANLYGDSGQNINRGYFIWNFGDGQILETDFLNPVEHQYLYSGNYTISLVYKYGSWSQDSVHMGKFNITVIDSPFVISSTKTGLANAVGIKNTRDNDYDLGSYVIRDSADLFKIPKNTFVPANNEIFIKLPKTIDLNSPVYLIDPAGIQVSVFPTREPVVSKNIPILANVVSYNQNFDENYFLDSSSNINSQDPIFIENNEKSLKESNKISNYYLLVIIIVSGSLVFFIRNKISSKKDDLSSEEYALQDE